jgi:PAS domain S-box-containing protein
VTAPSKKKLNDDEAIRQLRAAEEKYRTIFENSAVAITVTDAKERIISWNKLAEKLLGMGPEDLYLRPVSSLYPEAEWKKIRSYNIRDKGMHERLETKAIKNDGEIIDIEISISVLKDPDGNITGSIGLMSDVTERRSAERERQLAEEKYRTVFDNSAVAITLTDAQERIISWNTFAENLLGMGHVDLYLRPVKTLYSEEEWKKIRSYNIRQKGMQHHLETKMIKKSGEVIDIDISISVLKDAQGNITGSIGIIRDITERKRAEEELHRINQELEQRVIRRTNELIQIEKMKSVGRLAAGAAHEVKNPLAILIQGIYYLRRLAASDSRTEDVLDVLKDMEEAALRADGVVKDLLGFSAASSLNLKSENLNTLIEKALSLTKHEFDKHQIRIKKELDPGLMEIHLDANRIVQVFINLIMNATQAVGERGTVTVRTFLHTVAAVGENTGYRSTDLFRPGEKVAVAQIDDTGPGIPEEALSKIFDPFYTTKRDTGGTGLGLAVVRTIIELHHAWIELSNLEGGGARVTLMFKTIPYTAESGNAGMLEE